MLLLCQGLVRWASCALDIELTVTETQPSGQLELLGHVSFVI